MATILHRNVFRIIKPVAAGVFPQPSRLLSARTAKVAAFDDSRVQVLLKRITGRNLDKVFASRQERGVELPSYKLLTNEELSLVCIVKLSNHCFEFANALRLLRS